jgi:predicted protein tyrosine phosphatase
VLKRILFVSQQRAEAMAGHPRRALISITDGRLPQANLQDQWLSVLRVAFDDVDPANGPLDDPDVRPLTVGQAQTIAEFVLTLPPEARTLVVHCKAGISRSAGVARAVARCLGLRFPHDYLEYNRHACRLVEEQLRARASPRDTG